MKLLVCVKVVDGEINPFDGCAVECALRLSDDVTVLSMGQEKNKDVLLPLTRLGAKVILLTDAAYAGADTLATSYVLSQAAKRISFDLILCGRQSIDGDTAQVGPGLAAQLGIPVITNVMEIGSIGKTVSAITRMGKEKAKLPAVLTVERIAELRFPSIRSVLGEVTVWDNTVLSLDKNLCGLSGSPTRVLKTFTREGKTRHCTFVSVSELPELIEKLRGKKSGTDKPVASKAKIPLVWAVGGKVLPHAKAIGDTVIEISEKDPEEIAKRARKEQPDVILWNADLWGRRTAPIVAVKLRAGLCADCTALETDGTTLFMYRPAHSGDITAKIECRTKPQMATVRTKTDSADVIVSAGRGAAEDMEHIRAFAEKHQAEFGVSRALIDMNLAPYDRQIGLTGKKVSPSVYVAIGISGAVHHTCAIEGAGVIIAVNPDKNARIFDYADYGIIAKAEEI